MTGHEKIKLNIGDEIGFVTTAQGLDEKDSICFFKVVEVADRDGERAYRYQYPDGETSRAAIRQSDLASHVIRIHKRTAEVAPLYLEITREAVGAAIERANHQSYVAFITSQNSERDSFEVYSATSGKTYRVEIRETADNRVLGRCDCPDFSQRNRVCKHLSIVATSRNLIGIATRANLMAEAA